MLRFGRIEAGGEGSLSRGGLAEASGASGRSLAEKGYARGAERNGRHAISYHHHHNPRHHGNTRGSQTTSHTGGAGSKAITKSSTST